MLNLRLSLLADCAGGEYTMGASAAGEPQEPDNWQEGLFHEL
jgi:hypothetical protein